MLKDGREDLIDHFFEMHTKELGKPKINIDTSDLKHPELVKKMMTDEKLKPTLVKDKTLLKDSPEAIAKIKAENKAAIERLKAKKKTVEDFKDEGDFDPGGMASGGIAGPLHLYDGGRAGFKKGKNVDLSKRAFLKGTGATLGVLSMLPFVGKFFKPAAKLAKTKTLTSFLTDT